MKQITDKQIKQLKAVESHLRMAVGFNCKHNTTKAENDLVADVLDYITESKVNRNYSCSQCVFRLYQRLGRIYIDQLKAETTTTTEVAEETEPKQIINELDVKVTETKNKRGRKPNKK